MESNKSIKNVVLLIFNQCKEDNCELVNVNKIIEYIAPNFDLNSDEAVQLRISYLFELLRNQGKENNLLISEDDFERILQLWIPSIECSNCQFNCENSNDDDAIFSGSVHNRLSRSLTNIKQQIDSERERKLSFCQNWLSDLTVNDENLRSEFHEPIKSDDCRSQSVSPHDDPFRIPINVVRSTPRKPSRVGANKISGLQQPNLRFIKLHYNTEQASFSDSDAMHHYDGSYFEDDSSENIGSNKEINKSHNRRKRHRSSIVAQSDFDNVKERDLISQMKQIKFKNTQLMEINERLQTQLESVEENLRNLTTKCWNLEKKTKLYNNLSDENKQFVLEIDGIRNCLDKEVEYRRTIMAEKIITESELAVSKEHIQSLVERLSLLDCGLAQKDKMISNLKTLITQQEEFCAKLQELNLEKDGEIMKNEKSIGDLTETINVYAEKINILQKEKEIIQSNLKLLLPKDDLVSIIDKMESNDKAVSHDIGCSPGLKDNSHFRMSCNAEFGQSTHSSPWSIKVELAKQLVDSRGDNPFCEKRFFDDDCLFDEDADDSSFEMLKELLSLLSSLRMTLAKYKDHLETASITIGVNEHFSDEITLSYVSYLEESINLLASSTDKAARCQNQFNETFEFLIKRISNLKNDKKTLILQNEQLQLRMGDNVNAIDGNAAEKMCFLESELRRERLSASNKQKKIEELELGRLENYSGRYGKCVYCGKSAVKFSVISDMNQDSLATEALNLARDDFRLQQKRLDLHRSFSNVEKVTDFKKRDSWTNNTERFSRKSSSSVDELMMRINQDGEDTIILEDDHGINEDRNYYMSTDDLSEHSRHKLNLSSRNNIDIDKIIENSWLDANPAMDERRASVFAQVFEPPTTTTTTTTNNNNVTSSSANAARPVRSDSVSYQELPSSKSKQRTVTSSSSCSSSNDTSDANSVDVNLERRKLAKELESRTIRMQSRSPVPSLLGVADDLKSITPTVNEDEQITVTTNNAMYTEPNVGKQESRTASPVSLFDECSATESVCMDIPMSSRRSSINRPAISINVSDTTRKTSITNGGTLKRPSLPTISIMEVPSVNTSQTYKLDPLESRSIEENTTPLTRALTVDSEGNSLQASMNKSDLSSRASSVAGDDSKLNRRSKISHKRIRRPYTITGIGLVTSKVYEDDNSSNCDGQSNMDDINDIQESIDLLQEMKHTLTNISPEDLESKFNEMSLIYRTDRPTVIDRANDANKKCNMALHNVEQEFNVLRHLIKSVSDVVDQPSEFLPRIRGSIGVLEKCVEYLSAKSEILGAIEQELKMSSVIDVMNAFNTNLIKQREEHLRELEEARMLRDCSNTDGGIIGSFDQSRSKKSKDAKKKFQLLAQKTATKSTIVRQFAANSSTRSGHLPSISDNSENVDSAHVMSPFRRGGTSQEGDVFDFSSSTNDHETGLTRKYGFNKPDETRESLFQKGLHQGLRISTDQALTELRAEQSRLSSTLDSLSDTIEEYGPMQDNEATERYVDTRITEIKNQMISFFSNFKLALRRSAYVIVGFVVVVALLIPWLLSPSDPESSGGTGGSFSVPTSRRPARPSLADNDDQSSSSSPSSSLSPSYFSNVNVIRHLPAAI